MWNKLESLIKSRESLISLLLISLALLYIPFKITSYGWTPPDDALRHAAFATVDKSWDEIVVIKSEYASDHNPGWHTILRFFHKLGCNKTSLLRLSFIGLFLLYNFSGLFVTSKPIAWLVSTFLLIQVEPGMVHRTMLGRPFIFSFSVLLLLLKFWFSEENTLKKSTKLILSILAITLSVWIHGSWYLFLLLPIALILANKVKEAGWLTLCILAGTILGALLTGDFVGFLYFHVFATAKIFTEKTFNWLLVSEFRAGNTPLFWILPVAGISYFLVRKGKMKYSDLLSDSVFMLILLSWMLGIMTARFWADWGTPALTYWLAVKLSTLLDEIKVLNEPRIRYGLFLFVIVSTVFITTNDGGGRYSRTVFDQAIDFSEERLVGWAPEPNGIVYSDNMGVFYKHFHEYPNAPWKYILGFESALMPDENLKILRRIGYNFRLPEEFLPWINRMTKADRLITEGSVGDFPQLESIRAARNYWVYRLKTATDTADIASTTTDVGSLTSNISSATVEISTGTVSIATNTANLK